MKVSRWCLHVGRSHAFFVVANLHKSVWKSLEGKIGKCLQWKSVATIYLIINMRIISAAVSYDE